jgi:hypothetical protein
MMSDPVAKVAAGAAGAPPALVSPTTAKALATQVAANVE